MFQYEEVIYNFPAFLILFIINPPTETVSVSQPFITPLIMDMRMWFFFCWKLAQVLLTLTALTDHIRLWLIAILHSIGSIYKVAFPRSMSVDRFDWCVILILFLPYFLSDPKLLNNLNESVLDSAVAGNHLKLVKRYYSDRAVSVLSNRIFI